MATSWGLIKFFMSWKFVSITTSHFIKQSFTGNPDVEPIKPVDPEKDLKNVKPVGPVENRFLSKD